MRCAGHPHPGCLVACSASLRPRLAGSGRRFVAFGSYGQAILVDPALKLVMVHTAVEREAAGGRWEAERAALWQGVVQHHGGQ